jgi:DNA topoisomerase IA
MDNMESTDGHIIGRFYSKSYSRTHMRKKTILGLRVKSIKRELIDFFSYLLNPEQTRLVEERLDAIKAKHVLRGMISRSKSRSIVTHFNLVSLTLI